MARVVHFEIHADDLQHAVAPWYDTAVGMLVLAQYPLRHLL